MKKFLFPLLLLFVGITGCDDSTVDNIRSVSERINDLNKSRDEIKDMEDPAALMKEDDYLLEYEYPVRENESYVVTYRFRNDKCFEVKLDTYLDKESYTKKIQQEVLTDMANNTSFDKTKFKNDNYTWLSNDKKITVQLKTQNIERGTINLSVVINQ